MNRGARYALPEFSIRCRTSFYPELGTPRRAGTLLLPIRVILKKPFTNTRANSYPNVPDQIVEHHKLRATTRALRILSAHGAGERIARQYHGGVRAKRRIAEGRAIVAGKKYMPNGVAGA